MRVSFWIPHSAFIQQTARDFPGYMNRAIVAQNVSQHGRLPYMKNPFDAVGGLDESLLSLITILISA